MLKFNNFFLLQSRHFQKLLVRVGSLVWSHILWCNEQNYKGPPSSSTRVFRSLCFDVKLLWRLVPWHFDHQCPA